MTDRQLTDRQPTDLDVDGRGLSRRGFLSAAAGVAAGATLGPAAAVAEAAGGKSLPTGVLGNTGEKVCVLSAGTAFNLTPITMRAFQMEGINYIDTAESYNGGNSEKTVGEWFAKSGKRKETFLVTKSGNHEPVAWTAALSGCLQRLQTDYVDLYFLHNLGDPDRLDADMKAVQERLKKEGKIRFFGFSSHHRNMIDVLERAPEVGYVDAIMFKVSYRDAGNERLQRAIDKCHAAGIGLIAMKTQGGRSPDTEPAAWPGFNRHQAALKAMWEDERFTAICSEMVNIQQVRENADAARKGPRMGWFDREHERLQLQEYAERTDHLYCRGCGHICGAHIAADTAVDDILRFKMYHDDYGKRRDAKRLFQQLPAAQRQIDGVDFAGAEAACPYGLAVGDMLRDARSKLA
jgi:aryl-alcohol dehydrogenase-like predicted oxidoreductase